MGLKGKVLGQVEISFHGNIFHEIYRDRPHHLPNMCKAIHAIEGQWGTVGSILILKFTLDGKTMMAQDVIEAIDDEKKFIKYRVVGGDLLEAYKSFIITCQVDSIGEDDHFVTWTVKYEKVNETIPEPISFLETVLGITKDMDDHHSNLKP